MTSVLFVGVSWCARAIFCSGEVNLWKTLVPSLERGFVLGKVRRLTHSFVALSECRSRTERMLASASAIAIDTVRQAPVFVCAPILCTLSIAAMVDPPHACIQTFEA